MAPTGPGSLKSFLADNKITRDAAATALSVSRTVIYYWLEKGVTPSLKSRRDIAAWTNGAVREDEWEDGSEAATVRPFGAGEDTQEADPDAPTSPTNDVPAATGTERG